MFYCIHIITTTVKGMFKEEKNLSNRRRSYCVLLADLCMHTKMNFM